jgi:hypothetical protein
MWISMAKVDNRMARIADKAQVVYKPKHRKEPSVVLQGEQTVYFSSCAATLLVLDSFYTAYHAIVRSHSRMVPESYPYFMCSKKKSFAPKLLLPAANP